MEYEKVRRELHITFMNSLNRKHTLHLKKFDKIITQQDVQDVMESLALHDIPDANGVCQCARPLSAKIVEIKEHTVFEVPETETTSFLAMLPPMPKEEKPPFEKPKKPKKERTIISMNDMLRFSPPTITKAMEKDLEENHESDESMERYLINAIRSQTISKLLSVTKKIHPQNFKRVIHEMTDKPAWPDFLINHLENLQPFFTTSEWVDLMEKYQRIGKDATARLISEDGKPNYSKANSYMKQMLFNAKTAHAAYLEKERASALRFSRLWG